MIQWRIALKPLFWRGHFNVYRTNFFYGMTCKNMLRITKNTIMCRRVHGLSFIGLSVQPVVDLANSYFGHRSHGLSVYLTDGFVDCPLLGVSVNWALSFMGCWSLGKSVSFWLSAFSAVSFASCQLSGLWASGLLGCRSHGLLVFLTFSFMGYRCL